MNKISRYFNTLELTRGFFIALFGSLFIYIEYWGINLPILDTIFALLSLAILLSSKKRVWFHAGLFFSLFWFWWIGISFLHYKMAWAIPIVITVISFIYAFILYFTAFLTEYVSDKLAPKNKLLPLLFKALFLLLLSYIHPFSFDWFKPELMLINSYFGIEKWQFFIILLSLALTISRKNFLFLLLLVFALNTTSTPKYANSNSSDIDLVTLKVNVEDKWNRHLNRREYEKVIERVNIAIEKEKKIVVFPESAIPMFLNYNKNMMQELKDLSEKISIVVGALYWKDKTPYNSAYIFEKGRVQIANKVLLVPFGESNPLPEFLSDWVNKVFYDGAVDYKASQQLTDYKLNGKTYRNAICFEATSEKLYVGRPKRMIVLSNNGWFTPSTEPTLQKLLLKYYSQKYKTEIYHSVNMSDSYVIINEK